MEQEPWKTFARYQVRYRPIDSVPRWAGWALVVFFTLFSMIMVAMWLNSRNSDGSELMIAGAVPFLFLVTQLIVQISNRSILRTLDAMSKELGLEARCDYGAPLWTINHPHLVGRREGIAVLIKQNKRGKSTFYSQLLLQGSRLHPLEREQFAQVLKRNGMSVLRFDHTPDHISISVRHSFLARRSRAWLRETLSLLNTTT